MNKQRLAVFNKTLNKTYDWIEEVMEKTGFTDELKAYAALRVVLQAIRDHLPLSEVAQLGAQLPLLVRGFYYDSWHPQDKPLKERKAEDFLAQVKEYFKDDESVVLEDVVLAVFQVLSDHITEGEIRDIKAVLPHEIRNLLAA